LCPDNVHNENEEQYTENKKERTEEGLDDIFI